MKKARRITIAMGLMALLMLAACQPETSTDEWKLFAIEEKPAIDIQFRLPPKWHIDYAPTPDVPGQWDVALVPQYCAKGQETEYADNCIALTITIKGEADFDKMETLSVISQSMTLNESGGEETIFMGQNQLEVNGLTVQRYNHKLFIGEEEVALYFYFLETDSTYYLFVTELPYDEREGDTAETFNRLLESIEEIDG